jgi:hypothetical protein
MDPLEAVWRIHFLVRAGRMAGMTTPRIRDRTRCLRGIDFDRVLSSPDSASFTRATTTCSSVHDSDRAPRCRLNPSSTSYPLPRSRTSSGVS